MEYSVKRGDCLSSIAARFGFANYKDIYEHPKNEALRARRKDPNVIHPGDTIFIPDRQPKAVSCATGKVHSFELKRPQKYLRVVLQNHLGEPMVNTPYQLGFGATIIEKRTGDDGLIEELVPIELAEATLTIHGLRRTLKIGDLNPIEHADEGLSGIKARLTNLGFDTMGLSAEMDEDTSDAIMAFQDINGLERTGKVDEALVARLKEKYEC